MRANPSVARTNFQETALTDERLCHLRVVCLFDELTFVVAIIQECALDLFLWLNLDTQTMKTKSLTHCWVTVKGRSSISTGEIINSQLLPIFFNKKIIRLT